MPRAAFITGGSSGIGLALARGLAAKGHDIALFARDPAKLQDAVRDLKAAHPDRIISGHPADVSVLDQLSPAVEAAIATHGAPEWAIANAGIAEPGLFVQQPIESFTRQMDVNYTGALHFAKLLVPAMPSGGHLVFVSSGAAFFGIFGYAAYAPTKFALRGLAEVLRVELAPAIQVTLAYPPDTDTPQLAAEAATKPAATKEITGEAGVWQPQDVADLIISRAAKGKFTVAPGFQMRALLGLHSVLAPLLRWWQAGIVRKHHK
ncbi:Oxidoreductase, short-chain dehydrogenase/reductase family [Candidatus Rhodobacter oscarellae]|uniref:3-dehydrosphinganine reductase n=1 Tax=Candidatus Rhodobacter oscarellae TaxID=1675527 RepID=A0A0J9E3I9_9RHOB|nr:SDR family oxidoreductase [Candidatus Rhodobacter lobularis]KMW57386.1 Oxidoreductase, short-chain dehydrogenase/reductase family [Candidatus Rhodobacter lobularis]